MLQNGKTVKVVWGRDERKLQPYLPPAQIRLQFIQVDTLKDFERFKPIFQQITIFNVLLAKNLKSPVLLSCNSEKGYLNIDISKLYKYKSYENFTSSGFLIVETGMYTSGC